MKQFLVRPVITEKTMRLSQAGVYTFRVLEAATKKDIASQVADMFSVNVMDVHTVMMHGKVRRVGRKRTEKAQSGWKKAMVRLAKGQAIAAFNIGDTQKQ